MVQKTTFIQKLYAILSDSSFQHLIHWHPEGQSFIVEDPAEFARQVLPKEYKHGNFTSFVRQLNLYGFHKLNRSYHRHTHSAGGASHGGSSENESCEFRHAKFLRERVELLPEIRRKSSSSSVSIDKFDLGGLNASMNAQHGHALHHPSHHSHLSSHPHAHLHGHPHTRPHPMAGGPAMTHSHAHDASPGGHHPIGHSMYGHPGVGMPDPRHAHGYGATMPLHPHPGAMPPPAQQQQQHQQSQQQQQSLSQASLGMMAHHGGSEDSPQPRHHHPGETPPMYHPPMYQHPGYHHHPSYGPSASNAACMAPAPQPPSQQPAHLPTASSSMADVYSASGGSCHGVYEHPHAQGHPSHHRQSHSHSNSQSHSQMHGRTAAGSSHTSGATHHLVGYDGPAAPHGPPPPRSAHDGGAGHGPIVARESADPALHPLSRHGELAPHGSPGPSHPLAHASAGAGAPTPSHLRPGGVPRHGPSMSASAASSSWSPTTGYKSAGGFPTSASQGELDSGHLPHPLHVQEHSNGRGGGGGGAVPQLKREPFDYATSHPAAVTYGGAQSARSGSSSQSHAQQQQQQPSRLVAYGQPTSASVSAPPSASDAHSGPLSAEPGAYPPRHASVGTGGSFGARAAGGHGPSLVNDGAHSPDQHPRSMGRPSEAYDDMESINAAGTPSGAGAWMAPAPFHVDLLKRVASLEHAHASLLQRFERLQQQLLQTPAASHSHGSSGHRLIGQRATASMDSAGALTPSGETTSATTTHQLVPPGHVSLHRPSSSAGSAASMSGSGSGSLPMSPHPAHGRYSQPLHPPASGSISSSASSLPGIAGGDSGAATGSASMGPRSSGPSVHEPPYHLEGADMRSNDHDPQGGYPASSGLHRRQRSDRAPDAAGSRDPDTCLPPIASFPPAYQPHGSRPSGVNPDSSSEPVHSHGRPLNFGVSVGHGHSGYGHAGPFKRHITSMSYQDIDQATPSCRTVPPSSALGHAGGSGATPPPPPPRSSLKREAPDDGSPEALRTMERDDASTSAHASPDTASHASATPSRPSWRYPGGPGHAGHAAQSHPASAVPSDTPQDRSSVDDDTTGSADALSRVALPHRMANGGSGRHGSGPSPASSPHARPLPSDPVAMRDPSRESLHSLPGGGADAAAPSGAADAASGVDAPAVSPTPPAPAPAPAPTTVAPDAPVAKRMALAGGEDEMMSDSGDDGRRTVGAGGGSGSYVAVAAPPTSTISVADTTSSTSTAASAGPEAPSRVDGPAPGVSGLEGGVLAPEVPSSGPSTAAAATGTASALRPPHTGTSHGMDEHAGLSRPYPEMAWPSSSAPTCDAPPSTALTAAPSAI